MTDEQIEQGAALFCTVDERGQLVFCVDDYIASVRALLAAAPQSKEGLAMQVDALTTPTWNPEPPCWLVEHRAEGRTIGYLGHANGSYEWMATPAKATRFVRREDANGVAECIETADVIVAEHIWG